MVLVFLRAGCFLWAIDVVVVDRYLSLHTPFRDGVSSFLGRDQDWVPSAVSSAYYDGNVLTFLRTAAGTGLFLVVRRLRLLCNRSGSASLLPWLDVILRMLSILGRRPLHIQKEVGRPFDLSTVLWLRIPLVLVPVSSGNVNLNCSSGMIPSSSVCSLDLALSAIT